MQTKTKFMTTAALMTAVMCILAPMSIQIGPVPISFTNFVIYLAVYLLGTKGALASYSAYYLLGLFGLPVFSRYEGGIGKALGPTGGCLLGFFVMALICGIVVEKTNKKVLHFMGMALATFILYAIASVWFAVTTNVSFIAGFSVCAMPFIVIDMLKITFAIYLGSMIKQRIKLN